jgi:divalent metal cation (Fe/Co/Zn/Cd) transporter
MSASGSKKAIIAAFLANLGIAVAKFIGFMITGASSMLSEEDTVEV